MLAKPELRQLAQRVTGRYHLEALRRKETLAYIRHRSRVAGATRDLFTAGALREIHRLSGGVPRIINVIADRALLGAYTREQHQVDGALVRRAASEVYGRPVLPPWFRCARDRRRRRGRRAARFRAVARHARASSGRKRQCRSAAEPPTAAAVPAPPPREPLGAVLTQGSRARPRWMPPSNRCSRSGARSTSRARASPATRRMRRACPASGSAARSRSSS